MSLLIDGYNLLHVSGILGRGVGPGSLERSRLALLNFLAESLCEAEAARTTVVFDAGEDAPRELPRESTHRGVSVRFASRYDDADSLIEELIAADSAPRQLTVVSSDRRIQRAARRRRAKAIDSGSWYRQTLRDRSDARGALPAETKPGAPLSAAEIDHWVERFSDAPDAQAAEDDGFFPPGYADDLNDDSPG